MEDLDALDGDADMEPSLGAPEVRVKCSELFGPSGFFRTRLVGETVDQRLWSEGGDADEREAVSEDEGAQCDDEGVLDNEDACTVEDGVNGASGEYTLGWSEGESQGVGRGLLSAGSDEYEPSLGASAQVDQTQWGGSLPPGRDGNVIDAEDEHDGCEEEVDQNTGDDEPDHEHEMCNWQDEGDQTRLRPLPVYSERPASVRSPHQNVGPFFPVRVLR